MYTISRINRFFLYNLISDRKKKEKHINVPYMQDPRNVPLSHSFCMNKKSIASREITTHQNGAQEIFLRSVSTHEKIIIFSK